MTNTIKALLSLYSWRYPRALVFLWRHRSQRGYLRQYWQTNDFSGLFQRGVVFTGRERALLQWLRSGMAIQILVGAALLVDWFTNHTTGSWQFGLALLVAYPVIWAHLLPLLAGAWWVVHPKVLGRRLVCAVLEAQVRRLRRRNQFEVVAVVGSVGKTSTKIAIARLLGATRRVQWQEGNYNDRVTVPLIFFGQNEPGLLNVVAWVKIFLHNEAMLRKPYPYQIVVAELGTDGPGQLKQFAYIKPELVVVTAVTPEHMEFFKTIDAVAHEELSVLRFARQALVNVDDTPAAYLERSFYQPYSLSKGATYHLTGRKAKGLHGQTVSFTLAKMAFSAEISLLGDQGAKIALAAAAAAHMLGLSQADIEQGVGAISAFAGRMQVLPGIQNSTLIDDTYNSSPVAAKAALDVLYSGDAPQRIAVMGSMNELGDYSPLAHKEVGEYCDPSKLDWLITIGPDAKEYLAPVAKAQGCQVKTFLDPYKAGTFIKQQLKEGAVVLAKGSQNRVFAEEALKTLLAHSDDAAKLVRQSAYWMSVKGKQFRP